MKTPGQNPMSTDLSALLLSLGNGLIPFPLIAIEGGRFPGIRTIPAVIFKSCLLPEEAQAGLLLYAGFGIESHAISQNLSSPEAAYWHAIYHRMEPDDCNAKYWFRQVGTHPVQAALRMASIKAGWNPGRNWDHARFVDFISAARTGSSPGNQEMAIKLQHLEWQLLFEHCAKEIME